MAAAAAARAAALVGGGSVTVIESWLTEVSHAVVFSFFYHSLCLNEISTTEHIALHIVETSQDEYSFLLHHGVTMSLR